MNEALDTRVVGECGRGDEAARLVEETHPELVILSLDTAGEREGLEACRRLKALPEAPYVLVQTIFNYTKDLLSCLLAGADSCLHKHASCEELLDSARRTASGERILRLGESFGGSPHLSAAAGADRLTRREREVVALVVERHKTAEIAGKLHISPQTVKNHLRSAYRKLGIQGREALFTDP
ncbi:MAG: response regulator transcription factor [Actinomycetota bacterium]|nr:response regulator transcription factor [Actinomycetota bacterium]